MTTDFRAMCAELLAALEIQLDELRFNNRLCIRARALLDQPVAEGPRDEDILRELIDIADEAILSDYSSDVVDAGRRLLARWGTPNSAEIRRSLGDALQPVPVSERLPGPGDCLDEGWAWFFNQRIGWRQAVLPVSPGYTHWLPAHALPVPADD